MSHRSKRSGPGKRNEPGESSDPTKRSRAGKASMPSKATNPSEPPYDQNGLIKLYLDRLQPGCREDRVDHVWAQIISFYWPVSANYGVEREAYVSETSLEKANVVLTKIRNEGIRACLFIECKRPPQNKANKVIIPTPIVFDKTSKRLEKYMQDWQTRDQDRIAYGIVSIGEYAQFYQMEASSVELKPYKTSAQSFSVKTQVAQIHNILTDIRADLAHE